MPRAIMRCFWLLVIISSVAACVAPTKKLPGDKVVFYPFAKDSFLVRVTDLTPDSMPADTVRIVYYGDQSLKSGKAIGEMIEKYKSRLKQQHYVFVGIAHFGNYRSRRRRDFIPPSVETGSGYKGLSPDYGQADSFYHFLIDTIRPLAEDKFSSSYIKRSWIGHSLGGLFATYLLVNGDSLFSALYALSPALWIDDYHVPAYESRNQQQLSLVKKNIWISCGGNETINRIKNGVERIRDTLAIRHYPGIYSTIKIYDGETHNSSVEPALNDIFEGFLKDK